MASNYPGSLDSFDTIASDKKTSDAVGGRTHRDMHNDLGDAIEAIETELGTDPSGGSATVKARFEVIEANDWVTAARIAADAVGSSEIAADAVGSSELADSAVDTAAIADSAVTSAKIADGTITSTDVAASTFAAFGTVGNLLTANQASIETDTTGLGQRFYCTAARSTSYAAHGSASLTLTATNAAECGGGVTYAAAPAITANDVYTAVVKVRQVTGTRAAIVKIQWLDSGRARISETAGAATALTTSFTELRVTGTAPSTAVYAAVEVAAQSGSVSDVVALDCFGLWKGTGGQWALPGTPITGQSHVATNGAVNLSGTGVPEGFITAAPGSTWLQTDSTTDVEGWLRWIKATGTGNTGWVAGPEADTGWRDIASLLNTGVAKSASSGAAALCRTGDVVQAHFNVTISAGSVTQLTSGALPTGFRPSSKVPIGIVGVSTASSADASLGTTAALGYYAQASPIRLTASAPNPGTVTWTASWITDDAWPASLPGSAA